MNKQHGLEIKSYDRPPIIVPLEFKRRGIVNRQWLPLVKFLPFLILKKALSRVFSYAPEYFRGRSIVSVARSGWPSRGYGRRGYYLLSTGDLLHDRYQAISLLGYGRFAVLWLTQDLQFVPLSYFQLTSTNAVAGLTNLLLERFLWKVLKMPRN